MRIIINKSQEEVKRYNFLSKYPIIPLSDAKIEGQDVLAIFESPDFEVSLKQAVSLEAPVVTISSKDTNCYKLALGLLDPRAVIYYENGQILSTEKIFAQAPGLSVKLLVDICEYAQENKLYPDVYIWMPAEEVNVMEFSNTPKNEKSVNTGKSGSDTNTPPQAKTQSFTPAQGDLSEYLRSCDRIIAVLKTTAAADSHAVAASLAKQLNTVHLSVTATPKESQEPSYASSDGTTVKYNSSMMPGQYLVVEVDSMLTDALEQVYSMAYKVVHVAADASESLEPLKAWQSGGFKLDAVIPNDPNNMDAYKKDFKVYSVVDFAKFLKSSAKS